MIFVSPTYRTYPFIGEPYEKGDKLYVTIDYKGKPKEVRAYDEWQRSWGEAGRPRVERNVIVNGVKCFRAVNYNGTYGNIIGMGKREDGRTGFWKYRKEPSTYLNWRYNICKSVLFGWMGRGDEEPVWEFEPFWVDEEEVRVDNDCYKYLEVIS